MEIHGRCDVINCSLSTPQKVCFLQLISNELLKTCAPILIEKQYILIMRYFTTEIIFCLGFRSFFSAAVAYRNTQLYVVGLKAQL